MIQKGSNNEWMGSNTDPLQGFSWQSGTKRVTAGVMVWSDFFLFTKDTTGEDIAVVIMDTQGLFDNKTSPVQNSSIFALGTLISSIQILNLFSIIQEDHLQYLQFATEYARFASQDSNTSKPFQKLLFLIRDWSNDEEFQFGLKGGKAYLSQVLTVEQQQKPELKSVRQYISASFEELACSLLPYPGNKVARNKTYNGNWKEMEEDFRDELKLLIEDLAAPDNLVIKTINGKELNGAEMKQLIESYLTLFQSDKLPKAQSIYESTIDQQMNVLIEECLSLYKQKILLNQDIVTKEVIPLFKELCKTSTLLFFTNQKKMGNKAHEEKCKKQLEARMEQLFKAWELKTVQSLKEIAEEKRKTAEAIEEKRKQEEKTRIAIEEAKAKQIELQKALVEGNIKKLEYDLKMEKVNARLEAEKLRFEVNEEARKENDQLRKDLLALQESLDALKRPKPSGGNCSVL